MKPDYEEIDAHCEKHGVYRSRVLIMRPDNRPLMSCCPTCAEESREADRQRKLKEELAKRADDVRRVVEYSCIPARFLNRQFSDYQAKGIGQTIALQACQSFAEDWPDRLKNGGSLVLTGGPGTGKTHLACAIGLHIMREHLASVYFATVATMLRGIKDTYRKDSEQGEQDAIDDLIRPRLLILDEVGVQVGSEHEKMLMFEVLNARYQENRPSILISNLASDELETFLGHRLMDRYRECGSVLAFNWDSYRGQNHGNL